MSTIANSLEEQILVLQVVMTQPLYGLTFSPKLCMLLGLAWAYVVVDFPTCLQR